MSVPQCLYCQQDSAGNHESTCPLISPLLSTSHEMVAKELLPRGWVCPVCGAGVSPIATKCPCTEWHHPLDFMVCLSSVQVFS